MILKVIHSLKTFSDAISRTAVDKISTELRASRGLSAIAELVVIRSPNSGARVLRRSVVQLIQQSECLRDDMTPCQRNGLR